MSLSTKKVVPYNMIIMWILLLCLNISAPTTGYGFRKTDATTLKTIVIDPGHGGDNYGTKGPRGTLEKDVVLRISQIAARYLQHQFNVLLTRDDDRDLPLSDRTAMANHHKADLFISIHTGGGFDKEIDGSTIAYFSAPKENILELDPQVPQLSDNHMFPAVKWEKVQLNHISTSHKIAEALRSELKKRSTLINPSTHSAPLYILAGADMPALYIEPFFLTHPTAEKHFQNEDNLQQLARDMATGIAVAMQNVVPSSQE